MSLDVELYLSSESTCDPAYLSSHQTDNQDKSVTVTPLAVYRNGTPRPTTLPSPNTPLNCKRSSTILQSELDFQSLSWACLGIHQILYVSSLFPISSNTSRILTEQGNEWDFYPLAWKDKKRGAVTFGFDGSCESHLSSPSERFNPS